MADDHQGKTKVKSSSRKEKIKAKAQKPPKAVSRTDKDTVELNEDSGVHLEEPLTPHRSWDGDLDESSQHFLRCPEEDSGFHVPMSQADKSYPSNISEEFSDKCSLGASDAGQLRCKSESPHKFTDSSPTSCLSASSRMPCLSASDARTRISSPESSHYSNDSPSPDPRDASKVHFSFGSDSENEDKTPKNLPPVGKKPSGKDREHRRGRFRRMLRPLRRSHSAGCAKDVPAHALFLKHEMERKQKQLPRRSFDRQVSFESDTEDQQHVEKKGSKKKRSFTKDMKEKFFFLRRRHTDTALSGQASEGKSGKLHIDTIIEWSKDFENLLMDKHGLELFREFLRSEYSEENVEFWIACQEYKSIKQKDMATRAHEIYSDFVAIQAPHEINLDSKTRLATMSNLSKPNAQTFEMAQKKIQGLMAKDSYRRFLQSDIYQSLLGDHKINL